VRGPAWSQSRCTWTRRLVVRRLSQTSHSTRPRWPAVRCWALPVSFAITRALSYLGSRARGTYPGRVCSLLVRESTASAQRRRYASGHSVLLGRACKRRLPVFCWAGCIVTACAYLLHLLGNSCVFLCPVCRASGVAHSASAKFSPTRAHYVSVRQTLPESLSSFFI
jgi:hypothetical protein